LCPWTLGWAVAGSPVRPFIHGEYPSLWRKRGRRAPRGGVMEWNHSSAAAQPPQMRQVQQNQTHTNARELKTTLTSDIHIAAAAALLHARTLEPPSRLHQCCCDGGSKSKSMTSRFDSDKPGHGTQLRSHRLAPAPGTPQAGGSQLPMAFLTSALLLASMPWGGGLGGRGRRGKLKPRGIRQQCTRTRGVVRGVRVACARAAEFSRRGARDTYGTVCVAKDMQQLFGRRFGPPAAELRRWPSWGTDSASGTRHLTGASVR
jgi:hypothetical protein